MSKKLSAAARTSITISPGSGRGSSTSASCNACSGSPSLCTCQALKPGPSRGLPYRLRDYHSDNPAGMLSCGEKQGSHGRKQEGSYAQSQGLHDAGRRYARTRGERRRGLVSDRDLRDVRGGGGDRESDTPRWVSLGDMMTRDIVTIHPLDTIEHAAREIYDRKIGCLPVVADDELVGIITSADMMRTLIEMVGAHGIGTWVEVEVPNQPGTLAEVTNVIRDRRVNIASIFLGPASRETNRLIVLRLETTKPAGIVEALRNAGYGVTTVESSPVTVKS